MIQDKEDTEAPQDQVYTYQSDQTIYAIGFSTRSDQLFRLAVCSFSEEVNNKIQIIQLNQQTSSFQKNVSFFHQFPANKVLWIPDENCNHPDIFATSGQKIKIWEVAANKECSLKSALTSNNRFSNPLTSFDWNVEAVNLICTSSIDTTCTIWDIEKETILKQMIAHEREVYDIGFSVEKDIFASVSADGSLRQFDLRCLKHSILLYESQDCNPLLKMAWNRNNKNYIAVIQMDQENITLIDCRHVSKAAARLKHHKDCVNAVCWAPHSSMYICSVGDDKQALIWDLSKFKQVFDEPLLQYRSDEPIANLCWSNLQTDWLSICYSEFLQILKI